MIYSLNHPCEAHLPLYTIFYPFISQKLWFKIGFRKLSLLNSLVHPKTGHQFSWHFSDQTQKAKWLKMVKLTRIQPVSATGSNFNQNDSRYSATCVCGCICKEDNLTIWQRTWSKWKPIKRLAFARLSYFLWFDTVESECIFELSLFGLACQPLDSRQQHNRYYLL